jgi:glycosyltransferase involved in cell wall biosynthesis
VKVVVLTTSYPTAASPVAGNFVATAVEAVRAQGVQVDVVSPAVFPHFGVAYRGGIAQNLRAQPWRLAFVPAFLAAYAAAARRAARDADLVHAHWIPSALAARATGKPYVLQVWGTDVELAQRVPRLVQPLVRGARLVIAASAFLADAALALGAREVRLVPPGVDVPEHVSKSAEPPHVLFAGRLSEEKGILEFLQATDGLPRVIVGDGPLRDRVGETVGFVAPEAMSGYYDRAAVVAVPSRREGFGMVAREAMAYGRPVVATRVGGLSELGDGAVLVEPGDLLALRQAVESLLEDRDGARAVGSRGRSYSVTKDAAAAILVNAYVSSIS